MEKPIITLAQRKVLEALANSADSYIPTGGGHIVSANIKTKTFVRFDVVIRLMKAGWIVSKDDVSHFGGSVLSSTGRNLVAKS